MPKDLTKLLPWVIKTFAKYKKDELSLEGIAKTLFKESHRFLVLDAERKGRDMADTFLDAKIKEKGIKIWDEKWGEKKSRKIIDQILEDRNIKISDSEWKHYTTPNILEGILDTLNMIKAE